MATTPRDYRIGMAVLLTLAFVSWVLVLSGLSAMQRNCSGQTPNTTVGAMYGIRGEWVGCTVREAESAAKELPTCDPALLPCM